MTENELNLEISKQLSFAELVQHGIDNGANIVNGMPWSWRINGKAITHENDDCYIIETLEGHQKLYKSDFVRAVQHGLIVLKPSNNDTHAPSACPM